MLKRVLHPRVAGPHARCSLATFAPRTDAVMADYARITDADAAVFERIVGKQGMVTDADKLKQYNTDWLRQYEGRSTLALRPRNADEVAAILKHCNGRRIAVVPQGGNTGLVGGSVPLADELIVSTDRMTDFSIDPTSGALTAQAGCILEKLDNAAAEHGLTMPLDLGAKGSCHIGGNVATNAGGLRYLRYGPLHGSVLGLRAVTGTGDIIDAMSTLRKDNVGYSLKNLFIGSEGTLGLITDVAVQLAPRPTSVQVAMFGLPSWDAVMRLMTAAKKQCGEILSAVEFMDGAAMDQTVTQIYGARDKATGAALSVMPDGRPLPFPLSDRHPFYVVIETAGSNAAHDNEKLATFLESVMADGTVSDGVVAQSASHARSLWRLREDCAVAASSRGFVFKYDLSFPVSRTYELVEVMRKRLAKWADKGVNVIGYTHIADGNVHLNVVAPVRQAPWLMDLEAEIEPFVFEWTLQQGGSISAEHGVGQAKAGWLRSAKPATSVALMTGLKGLLDPRAILSPGKVVASRDSLRWTTPGTA